MASLVAPTQANIARAVAELRRGGLVAFPTETVYGLGADAFNPAAIERLFRAKGRPRNHPVIVHFDTDAWLDELAVRIPAEARELAHVFWPGPLTLILERNRAVPAAVTGGQDTVGLRMPRHPVANELLRAFGGPLVAPSANRFGGISPTRADHVFADLAGSVALILDGGASEVGLESTVLDLSRGHTALLRPGAISAEAIADVLGRLPTPATRASPRTSGSLASHYAPSTPSRLVAPEELVDLVSTTEGHLGVLARTPKPELFKGVWRQLPNTPEATGKCLYAALRDLDALGLDLIVVEEVPPVPAWVAVRDRLARATAGREGEP